jgi:hypothetical protein
MAKRFRQDNDRVDAMIASVRPRALLHAALNSPSEGDREILALTAWEG